MARMLVGFILGVSVALGVGAFAIDQNTWMYQQEQLRRQQQQSAWQQVQIYEQMKQRQMLEQMMKNNPCR